MHMYTFKKLDNREFGRLRSYYLNNGEKEVEKWMSFVYSSIDRTLEANDPSHLNVVIECSRYVERYRSTMRVLNSFGFSRVFKRDGDNGWQRHAKMTKAHKENAKALRQSWEATFMDAVMREGDHQQQIKKQAPSDWSKWLEGVESFLDRRIKIAKENNAPADVIEKLEAARKAA